MGESKRYDFSNELSKIDQIKRWFVGCDDSKCKLFGVNANANELPFPFIENFLPTDFFSKSHTYIAVYFTF